MKKQNLFTTTLLALAGATLLAVSAHADTSIINPAATCDMILGFRVGILYDDQFNPLPSQGDGASINLEIDLGSASQFYNPASSSFTLSGLAVADIVAAYGANWSTRTDLYWGIIGAASRTAATSDGHAPAATIWATRAEETPGEQSIPWNRGSLLAQRGPISQIEPLYVGTAPLNGATSTENSPVAALIGASTPGSWTSQDLSFSTSTSFGYFNGTIDNTTTIPVGGFSVLDLYELKPGSGSGTLLGAFGLDSAGTLTFSTDPALFAVPEPSSMVLLGLSGCIFALRLRRQRQSAVA